MLGGATGKGLVENVKVAYRFLANNYEPEDEIYIFGFSRGAYTARSLAGLIGWLGMIRKNHLEQLTHYFERYRKRRPGESPPEDLQRIRWQQDVPIECVGVWDTVGALGIPARTFANLVRGINKKYAFLDTTLGDHIRHGFHAVAIDEKRGPFTPTLWSAPEGVEIPTDRVRQAWFPGVHSNVGGSYDDAGLSDHALLWMVQCVRQTTGLKFDDAYLKDTDHVRPDALGTHYDSLGAYVFSRMLPMIRVIGSHTPKAGWLHRRLKRMSRPPDGQVYVNEMIHRSALERFGHDAPFQQGKKITQEHYTPANLAAAMGKLPVAEYDGSISQPSRPKPAASSP